MRFSVEVRTITGLWFASVNRESWNVRTRFFGPAIPTYRAGGPLQYLPVQPDRFTVFYCLDVILAHPQHTFDACRGTTNRNSPTAPECP